MTDKVISETPAEKSIPVEVLESTPPEQTPGVEAISNRDAKRQSIEEKVSEINDSPNVAKEEAPVTEAAKPTEEVSSDKTEDNLKKSIQKRINKEVAKRKTAEEELADARAEIERLRSSKTEDAVNPSKSAEPTIEQCEAYIIKMREEGNVQQEVSAMRYLVKLEKDAAIKAVKEEQEAERTKVTQVSAKQQSDWISLNRDYESENPELNLSNQSGLLYKKAMELYQDPELREVYSDSDRIAGFRKAVHDTYRHLVENGLPKKHSETIDTTPRVKVRTPVLAEPITDSAEETSQSAPSNLSDAEKVREEILNRRKNRTLR